MAVIHYSQTKWPLYTARILFIILSLWLTPDKQNYAREVQVFNLIYDIQILVAILSEFKSYSPNFTQSGI